jgi:hypothetical protein
VPEEVLFCSRYNPGKWQSQDRTIFMYKYAQYRLRYVMSFRLGTVENETRA